MHHYYYGDINTLDLNKMRDDAQKRLPEKSVIHYHKHLQTCTDKIHEEFPKPKEEINE